MPNLSQVPSSSLTNNVELIMLVLGVGLFLILAVVFIVSVTKDRKVLPLLPFFFVAIVMIGFPVIHSFVLKPNEIDVQMQDQVKALDANVAAVKSNPGNPVAIARLRESLQRTEALARNKGVNNNRAVAATIEQGNLVLTEARKAPTPFDPKEHKP